MSKDEIRKYIIVIESIEQYLDENTPQQLIDELYDLKCLLLMDYMV
jgi:hypothetical protein